MSDSWVGGDIGGLRTMAETYKNAKKKLEDVVRPLSSAVEELVGDASWKGDAAEAFRATWSEDALTAGAFANLVHDAGEHRHPRRRAVRLRDRSAERRAHRREEGRTHGRPGAPLPFVTSDPPSADEQRTISAFGEYDKVRTEILHTARHREVGRGGRCRDCSAQVTAPVSPGDKDRPCRHAAGSVRVRRRGRRAGGEERPHTDRQCQGGGAGGQTARGAQGLSEGRSFAAQGPPRQRAPTATR